MADVFSKEERSRVMASIRSNGNKETEVRLVRILRSNQIIGWRRHLPMAGMPDFAFQKPRLVVFVDGCFWHGCPTHYREPKSNKQYWKAKIARNCERDRVVSRELRTRGWKVLRIWEHDLRNEAQIVRRIRAKLSANNAQ